jgi:hypothetical protein
MALTIARHTTRNAGSTGRSLAVGEVAEAREQTTGEAGASQRAKDSAATETDGAAGRRKEGGGTAQSASIPMITASHCMATATYSLTTADHSLIRLLSVAAKR